MTEASAATGGHRSRWLGFRVTVIDKLVALALLPLLGPVMAVLAWLVRREDGPPSFIALDRIGRGSRAPHRRPRILTAGGPSRFLPPCRGGVSRGGTASAAESRARRVRERPG